MGLLCSLPLNVVVLACVHSRAGGLTLGCTQSPLVGSIQSSLVGSGKFQMGFLIKYNNIIMHRELENGK